ncbi:MAG TPA: hypothetical protein VF484_09380 [Candidatus Limnocylindrales bacterium]
MTVIEGPQGLRTAFDAELVADLGFTLVDSHRPGPSGSHLVVALRSRPSERHFDPETVAFYAPAGGRGAMVSVDRRTALRPPLRRVLWGHVHLVDRFAIENRFLSFGGMLRAAEVTGDLTILDLESVGPIVRWGGHSQGTDRLAAEIGAFFGRLIVPIDFRPGVEATVDALPPVVLYAAFLADLDRRLAADRRRGVDETLSAWLATERGRIERIEPAWHAGRGLLHELGLDR